MGSILILFAIFVLALGITYLCMGPGPKSEKHSSKHRKEL